MNLKELGRVCRSPIGRVMELLSDELEATAVASREAQGFLFSADDDSGKESAFTYTKNGLRRTVPLRKARDAWRLAIERGVVPLSWGHEPRRKFPAQELVFHCGACGGMGATGYNYDDICSECGGRGNAMERRALAEPTSIASLWLLAFPDVVEEAEQLARVAVSRLPNGPAVSVVQWGRRREEKPSGTIPLVIVSPIWDSARPAPWNWDEMKGSAFHRTQWWKDAQRLDKETREMLCFDVGGAWANRSAGRASSPFEPLLRLWELGIVFEEIVGDRIVLDRACSRTLIRTVHKPKWENGIGRKKAQEAQNEWISVKPRSFGRSPFRIKMRWV